MPYLLRMLCQGGMVAGPLLFISTLVPMGIGSFNGKPMTYAELWSSGAAASAAIFTLMVTVGCWGLAARALRSRWALVLSPLVPYIPLAILSPTSFGVPASVLLLEGGVGAALIYVCLFRLRSVRRYLEG
jgi:hypothetical protein